VLVVLLSACSAASGSPPVPQGPIRVLAAETFLADIAQNVAGQRLTVESLLPEGVDPHEFQPTPQDAIKIAQSQVFIVNGLGYETWLTKSLQDSRAGQSVIIATRGLTANPDPTGDHPAGDPHMWMAPLNVVQYVANIRDGLSEADPAGRALYAANADAYMTRLKELDASIKSLVAQLPPGKRVLVTNHDALAYFAQAYGFQVVGAITPSVTSESSPSARQMAALIDTIKSAKAPAIFLDVSENQDLARQLGSATGASVVTDLYVETLSAAGGPAPDYLEMIRHDAQDIVNALK
jgi:zinc/manganese transport system substrate-binding protein